MADHHVETVTSLRRGFSLIEMMGAVALLGLISGGVVWSVSRTIEDARRATFGRQLVEFQQRCRNDARFNGTGGQLLIKPNCLQWKTGDRSLHRDLNNSCRIESVMLPNQQQEFYTALIAIDFVGASESFALQIVPRVGHSYWLFCLGGTGQMIHLETTHDVIQFFDQSSA